MAWLMAKFYDRAMRATEEACLRAWRVELLEGVRGCVVEIGSGTGVTLPLYPEGLERLVLTEPDRHMRAQLADKARALGRTEVEVLDAPAEALPLEDASVDAVVTMLVLCSVSDPARTLAEARRVLRPGGHLLFIEHVAAEDRPGLRFVQTVMQPFQRLFAGNCRLTRRTGELIAAAGFEFDRLDRVTMLEAPAWVRPTILGRARVTASRRAASRFPGS